MTNERSAGQQLAAVRDMADEVVENDTDLSALEAKLQQLLERKLPFRDRPSWDEYFMNIARQAATELDSLGLTEIVTMRRGPSAKSAL